jgi:predicted CXXCH cytochrome family protein
MGMLSLFLAVTLFLALTCQLMGAVPSEDLDESLPDEEAWMRFPLPCISSECHQSLSNKKFIHPNMKENKCRACHTPEEGCEEYKEGPKHKFRLAGKDGELCLPCHPVKGKEFLHEPIEKKICLDCHDAHQSDFPKLVKGNPIGPLCLNCHVKGIFVGKTIHGPVGLGHCTICHESHESHYEALTRGKPTDECFRCHEDTQKELAGKEYIHKPVREDCNECHDPHASAELDRLKLPVPEGCFDCHKKEGKYMQSVTVKHDAITTEKKCLNCHKAHASNLPKELADTPLELCLVCHKEPLETEYGSIRNMLQFLNDSSYVHGPIKKGDCSACHDPHGSDYWRIVKQFFPQEFYAPFTLGMYELCFSCHEKTAALMDSSTTATGFRNGTANLHYTHVNKEYKGRTCKVCHDIHASNNPLHVTDEVPFGEWLLPLNFEQLDNGGRCTPGCHEAKEYDRLMPVENQSTAAR